MTKARSNATANAAKGDLTVGNGTNLSGVLGVGSNGDTIVADSSTSTGLRYQANFAAGKNKIINGDFGIWQRGTSFTTAGAYTADRFYGLSDASQTFSRQTFTPGTAPVAGYEGQYFFRAAKGGSGSYVSVYQLIENVQTLAGQTATISFWVKADSNQTIYIRPAQNFGSGGSGAVVLTAQTFAVTTSWTRVTGTFAFPSIAGKTIGTSSHLLIEAYVVAAGAVNLDTWGWQVEAGSVATAFQTATGTLQGELAACQRYYWRSSVGTAYGTYGLAYAISTTLALASVQFPVAMRTNPASVDFSGLAIDFSGSFASAVSAISLGQASTVNAGLTCTTTGLTQYRVYDLCNNNNTAAYLGFSAEL